MEGLQWKLGQYGSVDPYIAVPTQQEITHEDLRWLAEAVRDFVESYEYISPTSVPVP
ncbi:hypothetical protein V1515DRAFT_610824 [Lipomyces mesembrius]